MTANNKTVLIARGMFDGEKLYQQRARKALPLLVRHAIAGSSVSYSDLAEELGIPNPRNMNFILGSVGTTLKDLEHRWKTKIPPIQSLATGKNSGLPGDGFFEGYTNRKAMSQREREALLGLYHAEIFGYSNWTGVLDALGLKTASSLAASTAVEKARRMRGVGEGKAHRELKDRIFESPSLVKCHFKPNNREREYPLPSGDRLDVFFENDTERFAVEVKPSTSPIEDIARGLFQCVKYKVILSKWSAWQSKQVDVSVVLALGGHFPKKLNDLRILLGVDVIDSLDDRTRM